MTKPTMVSVRLDAETQELLKRCRASGRFATTMEIMTAGLRLLARELRQDAIRHEIAQGGADAFNQAIALVGIEEWEQAWERADQGEL